MMPTDEHEMAPSECYFERIVLPEIALLVATILLVIVTRLGSPGIGGIFAFVLGAIALRLDRRMFSLIPSSMWPEEERQEASGAAMGACVVFTLLLLGVFLSAEFPFGFLCAAFLIRALVPGIFTWYWYSRFAEEIFPLIQSGEYEKMVEALDRETAVAQKQARLADANKEAQTRGEDALRQGRRLKAIQEARQSVLKFYRPFAVVLRRFVTMDRLQAEIRTAIPDTVTEEQAFAGACALLDRLQGFIHTVEAEKKVELTQREQSREKIAGLDRQTIAIAQEITALQRNSAIDPELRDAEVQSLEAKRRALLEQRSLLQSRAN